jgi:hypothetical protein
MLNNTTTYYTPPGKNIQPQANHSSRPYPVENQIRGPGSSWKLDKNNYECKPGYQTVNVLPIPVRANCNKFVGIAEKRPLGHAFLNEYAGIGWPWGAKMKARGLSNNISETGGWSCKPNWYGEQCDKYCDDELCEEDPVSVNDIFYESCKKGFTPKYICDKAHERVSWKPQDVSIWKTMI